MPSAETSPTADTVTTLDDEVLHFELINGCGKAETVVRQEAASGGGRGAVKGGGERGDADAMRAMKTMAAG